MSGTAGAVAAGVTGAVAVAGAVAAGVTGAVGAVAAGVTGAAGVTVTGPITAVGPVGVAEVSLSPPSSFLLTLLRRGVGEFDSA